MLPRDFAILQAMVGKLKEFKLNRWRGIRGVFGLRGAPDGVLRGGNFY